MIYYSMTHILLIFFLFLYRCKFINNMGNKNFIRTITKRQTQLSKQNLYLTRYAERATLNKKLNREFILRFGRTL